MSKSERDLEAAIEADEGSTNRRRYNQKIVAAAAGGLLAGSALSFELASSPHDSQLSSGSGNVGRSQFQPLNQSASANSSSAGSATLPPLFVSRSQSHCQAPSYTAFPPALSAQHANASDAQSKKP